MSDTVNAMLVTVEEAGRLLALGRSTVYALVAQGRLSSIKIGRARRVPITELRRFIETELGAEELDDQEGDQR